MAARDIPINFQTYNFPVHSQNGQLLRSYIATVLQQEDNDGTNEMNIIHILDGTGQLISVTWDVHKYDTPMETN